MNKRPFIIFLWLITAWQLSAQPVKHYSVKNGLPTNVVYHVFQDDQQYLWFSTESGVCRFNGFEFELFNTNQGLPDPDVFESCQSEAGRIWFFVSSGVPCYWQNDTVFTPKNSAMLQGYPPARFIRDVVDDGQDLIISNFGNGLWYNGSSPAFSSRDAVYLNKMYRFSDDYYAVSTEGIFRIFPDSAVLIESFPALAHVSRSCMNDSEEIVFTAGKQLARFRPGAPITYLKGSEPLMERAVNRLIYLDGQYVACTEKGFVFFRLKGDSISIQSVHEPHLSVSHFLQDHEGNYWVTTLENGVFRYRSFGNEVEQLDDRAMYTVALRDEVIYTGMENYCFGRYAQDSVSTFCITPVDFYLGHKKPRTIRFYDDEIWASLDGRICRITDDDLAFFHTKARDIYVDDQYVWMGNEVGLWRYKRHFFLDSLRQEGELPGAKAAYWDVPPILTSGIVKMAVSGDFLYVAGKEGLFRINQHTSAFDTLWKGEAVSVSVQSGLIVIGEAAKGVIVLRDGEVFHIDERHGLSSPHITSVLIDREERIHVGTIIGVDVFQLEKDEVKPVRFSVLGEKGAYVTELLEKDSSIYVTAHEGLFRYAKKTMLGQQRHQIPVHLGKLTLNDSEISTDSTAELYFSHDQNRVAFEISPIVFAHNEKALLHYRLNDAEWISTQQRRISFNALSPGAYTFSCKVCVGSNCSQMLRRHFVIAPPFWVTWWFITLLVTIVLLLVYWFFKVRILVYNRDIARSIMQLLLRKLRKEKYIVVKDVSDGSKTRIPLREIFYVQSAANYVTIFHTREGKKTVVRSTMKAMLTRLSHEDQIFFRIHKSYIVNILFVHAIHSDFVKVSEQNVPVGDKFSDELEALKRKRKIG